MPGETSTLLRESVLTHAQADVPVESFLSGGTDSTIIAALLRELGPLRTFSLGYADARYYELPEVAETAPDGALAGSKAVQRRVRRWPAPTTATYCCNTLSTPG